MKPTTLTHIYAYYFFHGGVHSHWPVAGTDMNKQVVTHDHE